MVGNVADYRSLDHILSMGLISKRPKLFLYAQNSPKDSIGPLLGTLPARRFGRVHCWEAIGDARREFKDQLKERILNYLEKNNDKVQDSCSIIDLSLFMLGRSPVQAKPTVMFVSRDKKARKEAFDMIKKSGVLKDYPGFELGHLSFTAEFENLRLLAGRDTSSVCEASSIEEPLDVFSPRKSKLVGQRLYCYPTSNSKGNPQAATAGGAITYRGRHMLLTVDHFLEPAQTIATPSLIPSLDEDEDDDDECEITGLSEFEDEDEDQLAEVTSQGSITPEFEGSEFSGNESNNDRTSIVSSESRITLRNDIATLQERLERLEENQASILPNDPPTEHGTKVGKAVLRSKELDYSLVEINPDLMSVDDIRANQIDLEDASQIERHCRDAAVKTTTPDGGIVGGTLSGTPSYVRLPHSKTFVEVYIARFNRPLMPGDCGSWVRDAITGCLFGHVFAGSPTSGLTMIMPACHVFEDARRSLESQYVSEIRSSRDILSKVDRKFLGTEGLAKPALGFTRAMALMNNDDMSAFNPYSLVAGRNMLAFGTSYQAFHCASASTESWPRDFLHPPSVPFHHSLIGVDVNVERIAQACRDAQVVADQTVGAPEISHDYVPKNMVPCQSKAKAKALPRFSQRRELKNMADGNRSPPVVNTQQPKAFGCPFAIEDPARYYKCSGLRLRRPSDVSQHLARCHLLQEKTLAKSRDTVQQVYPEATMLSFITCRVDFEPRRSINDPFFSMRPQYAGTPMASICSTALGEHGLATSATTSPRQDSLILTRHPTQYRPGHSRDGVEGPLANAQLLQQFRSKPGLFENRVIICNVDDYTSLLGLCSTAPGLPNNPNSCTLPLTTDEYYGSGLQPVSVGRCGNDGEGLHSLLRAFEGGDVTIVRLLHAVPSPCVPPTRDGLPQQEAVVRLLFDQGIYAEANLDERKPTLSYAAGNRNKAVVQIILLNLRQLHCLDFNQAS